MKEAFIKKRFQEQSLILIHMANQIIDEYRKQGFILTLRQLYYQFVARDEFPDDRRWRWTGAKWVRDPDGTKNAQPNYKWLGSLINDGRLAGYIDWDAIEDRTRNLEKNLHLDNPKSAIQLIRDQYGIDMWENQDQRVEVWIEKEALVGVIADVCEELDVPYFACRGYVSQSEQWRAYKRFQSLHTQPTTIIHLGDHDPSGIDMTRDNQERLDTFNGERYETTVRRIALNMDQVEEYGPPPNPAKTTDSRFRKYVRRYGNESWELDALNPGVLVELIRDTVDEYRDQDLWEDKSQQLEDDIYKLDKIIETI